MKTFAAIYLLSLSLLTLVGYEREQKQNIEVLLIICAGIFVGTAALLA
jgi:hypothetical protein